MTINGKKRIIRANPQRTSREKVNDMLIGITAAGVVGVIVLLLTTYFCKSC